MVLADGQLDRSSSLKIKQQVDFLFATEINPIERADVDGLLASVENARTLIMDY